MDLRHRHDTKELMDRDDIPFADMAKTLKELDIINTRLGGHSITLQGLRTLAGSKKELVISEIGCGGGDNLRVIHRYCQRRNIRVRMIGIDINPECVRYASERNRDLPATWVCSDYAEWKYSEQPDIIFSSLFCHHFTDPQLVAMLRWLAANAGTGFFINDLHRHPLAYYLIKYITRFFSRSYLVRNDAAVSVSRGFSKKNWNDLFTAAGLSGQQVSWRWAFRWLVIFKN
ncbi:MAG: methyltransferase domain-containing protein [Chitinophagaceae bacterium]|nr:MAG: methyltransferase domain-containing protein [Chitinophagaceae bacterium]